MSENSNGQAVAILLTDKGQVYHLSNIDIAGINLARFPRPRSQVNELMDHTRSAMGRTGTRPRAEVRQPLRDATGSAWGFRNHQIAVIVVLFTAVVLGDFRGEQVEQVERAGLDVEIDTPDC